VATIVRALDLFNSLSGVPSWPNHDGPEKLRKVRYLEWASIHGTSGMGAKLTLMNRTRFGVPMHSFSYQDGGARAARTPRAGLS